MNAITKACYLLGGVSKTAKKLGVKPPTVSQWVAEGKSGGKPVPVVRCMQIEIFTDGEVSCEELNQDVDWDVVFRWLQLRMSSQKRRHHEPISQ